MGIEKRADQGFRHPKVVWRINKDSPGLVVWRVKYTKIGREKHLQVHAVLLAFLGFSDLAFVSYSFVIFSLQNMKIIQYYSEHILHKSISFPGFWVHTGFEVFPVDAMSGGDPSSNSSLAMIIFHQGWFFSGLIQSLAGC